MKRFLNYNKKLKQRASEIRKNMTSVEKKLWFQFLHNFSTTKHKVYRQRIIDHFIVDFYIPDFKLIIELDGESHLIDGALEYDIERTQVLEGNGCTIIRFTNTQINNNFEEVCSVITDSCQI